MTRLGFFGSVHSVEMMKQFGLDDDKVVALFDAFRPDIICGEVRKDDYEQNREYQGPSEYRRFIFKYCADKGIRFVPCDQYDDKDIGLAQREPEMSDEIKKVWDGLVEDFFKAGSSSEVPFNSDAFNRVVRKKHQMQYELDPEAEEVTWEKRNLDIARNVLEVMKENPDSDILVVFGAEHTYWLLGYFEKKKDVKIIFPLTYGPDNLFPL